MCGTCGCSDSEAVGVWAPSRLDGPGAVGAPRFDRFVPLRAVTPEVVPAPPTLHLDLEASVLQANDALAADNRRWYAERSILALNLVSSPGSGKTSLLERTVKHLHADWPVSVIEGDQATQFDAERIRAAGCQSLQVNTGTGCHLDARMIRGALETLRPSAHSLLLIENVGNLVCPALFDLGEAAKVVVLSVTEGEDKPLKYPHMFRAADLMLINKSDLAPHVDFDLARCVAFAREVNPSIDYLLLSAKTGEGMQAWYDWLSALRGRQGDSVQSSTRV